MQRECIELCTHTSQLADGFKYASNAISCIKGAQYSEVIDFLLGNLLGKQYPDNMKVSL